MEKTKEINQENVCGYCSNKIIGEECGTLTLKDKDGKIVDKTNICNGCAKRLHVKFLISKMSKEDVDSLDNFLRRENK